ncbi:MAG TPA: ABC transporter ATP-binding protein [Acetobacteraceae bacterium]|nr:ABC transporter ATP-binding protein [Acetobacteraceae bacterium]
MSSAAAPEFGAGEASIPPGADLAAASETSALHAPPVPGGGGVAFEGVTVAYKGNTVLADFTLTVRPGEIMAVIGPSGSGKTTALRAIAGFVRPVSGRLFAGGRDVTDLPPRARGIGMVVQNYALFPHMCVAENVAFGLKARRAAEPKVRAEVAAALAMVGMSSFAARYPRELSGGQQQRVAIARALAIRPELLLLDEPLSALDAQIRQSMIEELARLHRTLPMLTVLYVTHDQTEALTLADRIAILREGRLVALGPSRELYQRPPNRFAAEFLGRANLLPVVMETPGETPREAPREAQGAGEGMAAVRFGTTRLGVRASAGIAASESCLLCVRPHDLFLAPREAGANCLSASVREVRWKGDLHDIVLEAEGQTLRLTSAPLRTPPEPGTRLTVHFSPADATLIPERPHG